MTSCYLDTSFLIKLYVFEDHSAQASALLHQDGFTATTNSLTAVEVVSTIRRKVQDKSLTPAAAAQGIAAFRADEARTLFARKIVDEAVFALAEKLVDWHGDFIRLRSLDLIHVATALHHGVDGFATYDRQLKVLAERVGLKLLC